MSNSWESDFRSRMVQFGTGSDEDSMAVSIKIRITSGCFHREHSPQAYKTIDAKLSHLALPEDSFKFEEHESGPEILAILAVTTIGLTFTKSVIDLVTAIIKARSEGIKRGDHPSEPLELIVRGYFKDGEYHEEHVLRIPQNANITTETVEKAFENFNAHLKNKKKLPKKK